MKWSEPELTVVNMNAEIGGYQNDFDGEPRPYYGNVNVASARPTAAARGEPTNEPASPVRATE